MAYPTVVLIPLCVPGHLQSMLEAGKRLLSRSRVPMSLTVLVTQMTMSANLMSDVADIIRQETAAAAAENNSGGGGGGFEMRFVHLPTVDLPTVDNGLEDFMMRFIQSHEACVRDAIAGISSSPSPSPVAALVVDYFCATLLDVVARPAVPAYVYLTSGASMLAAMLRLPALDAEVAGDFEAMEEGAVVHLPGMPPMPASLMPTPTMRKDANFAWWVYVGNRFVDAAAGVIVNTVAELEPSILAAIAAADGLGAGRRRAPPPVYPIGPVVPDIILNPPPAAADDDENIKKKHECVRWLDAQPPASVVLLCFGSMGGSFSPAQVREIAGGLERSGHRFLWVLRGPVPAGSKYPSDADLGELLPEGFVERTAGRGLVWPRWAPQREILGSGAVGGFVTHCGWNSILEALWHGVPMLPWPLFAEQHMNAFELVSVMGVAVALRVDRRRDNFVAAEELERAVRCLMGGGGGEEEEGRKAREKAAEAKALCRRAVEDGGSSDVALQKLAREIWQQHSESDNDSNGCASASGESMGSVVVVPASPTTII